MKRIFGIFVVLSIQLFVRFSESCDCNAENLLLNRLDKLNEDIAKLVRDDMHFDGNHVALGPTDFMSNGFVYRRKRSDDEDAKRSFGGWMNRDERAFGGWKNRDERAFGGWKNIGVNFLSMFKISLKIKKISLEMSAEKMRKNSQN